MPRQIALQSSPQSQSRLAPLPPQSLPPQTLPPQTLPPQTLLPLPAKLPSLQPPRTEDLAAAAAPALLRVAVRESRLLRTPENVVRVVSEQDNICDVLLFNPREIAVVGKQRGQAK
ncbi:MAG: pilus assembly protein N-terminal domain-containing protein, partial [Pirellulaceae bacterium]|nr:pilus assembly protein N-terminal domain-containing protein [Pirellulaceae bacterium]